MRNLILQSALTTQTFKTRGMLACLCRPWLLSQAPYVVDNILLEVPQQCFKEYACARRGSNIMSRWSHRHLQLISMNEETDRLSRIGNLSSRILESRKKEEQDCCDRELLQRVNWEPISYLYTEKEITIAARAFDNVNKR